MIENLESKISFEIPNQLDLSKLIRGQNYTMLWQNLNPSQDAAARAAGMGSVGSQGELIFSEYNSSIIGSTDINLLSSLQNFASRGGIPSTGLGHEQLLDPTYERFIGDVWVGIVLTLMILSSIFCMCSCFLYHKFRQWQRNVLTSRSQTLPTVNVETPPPYDVESLPSYTIVSGLPSYNDAIEQLKQKQQQHKVPSSCESVKVHRPSVIKLFESQSQDLGAVKLEEVRYNFASTRSNSATGAAAEASVMCEVTPTSSTSNGFNMVPSLITPNSKSQIPASLRQEYIIGDIKKFVVCSSTVENERPIRLSNS
ncbi:protein commissureless 2 homolog [Uranotaenia lowii]|uniref:protein commissureless 2 homolog n=1 Tax=Uranotaenia lowii TaxID=190385 RepID=UPI00247945D0|nr:protein commissureless 2 homolog [Uranotaenia lowii]